MSGLVEEREGFLGLEGNEAFSLDNSSNLSKFNSLKIQKNIKDDLALTITGTLAYSDFEGDKSSLLKSANINSPNQVVISGNSEAVNLVITDLKKHGQTSAMAAGFDISSGEIVVTLDGDLHSD